VELAAVRERREHLGAVAAAERDRARILGGGPAVGLLEPIAQPATHELLLRARAAREHAVHDADQHALVIAQRRRVARRAVDQAGEREAAPLVGAREAERPGVLGVHAQEPRDLAGVGGAVAERLVRRQHREVLVGRGAHEVGDPRQLVGRQLAVGVDRHPRDVQAIGDERELDQHRQAGLVIGVEPVAQLGERLAAHRLAQAAVDGLGQPGQPHRELVAIDDGELLGHRVGSRSTKWKLAPSVRVSDASTSAGSIADTRSARASTSCCARWAATRRCLKS
jgi:hypothetical protein